MPRKETWSKKMARCNQGEYIVGDLVSQDNKRDFGFYFKCNIEVETAISLLGARAMEELKAAPKILKIICVNAKVMEGVQFKEGVWSIWTRRLDRD